MFKYKSLGIKDILLTLKIVNEKDIVLYSENTRDKKNLKVWKDIITKVIFIDEFYVGDKEYISGSYKEEKKTFTGEPLFERKMDLDRRFSMFSSFTFKKNILDFGCGNGDFLLEIKKDAKNLYAVDIDKQAFGNLKKSGINCYTNI